MRYFVSAQEGLGPLVREELATLGIVAGEPESDGRGTIVPFEAPGDADVLTLRLVEDVFAEVAATKRRGALPQLVRALADADGLGRALSVYAHARKPLHRRMGVRVVARVRSEREFKRTQLRDALVREVLRQRPRWVAADPAELELWAAETRADFFRLGVRLSTAEMRHRAGREVERRGALRPTVAAALVFACGEPGGVLYDPFCGSGTILAEALAARWDAAGSDIDPEAVEVARINVPRAAVEVADALALPLADGSVAAIASNLPFGKAYALPADEERWLASVLRELVRVARPGAPVVLLLPPSRALTRALAATPELRVARSLPIELLGLATTIWQLERV